ncbi:DHA1 family bicyclomycin/chloramphenicol resistance-like MFS transporter [Paraburkholderia sp. BL27I4N3]|uniref:multidrug effflux MFS transporter n=1 Tax=Paraburkholderia sp. BL27I4N3 TaxID=1938805 RepID=UPI000E223C45|nr:multidrug effflux MFS transporter [Paraburkholderia sp. BL27I4N3]REE07501.1 DHA1 family bicyclomycin/chloramphenicol resistance-like MFS transporter [Paraburkholderia sp. BL27I4N3]
MQITAAERGTNEPRGWRVQVILGSLMALASISTDTYLPAMPTMAHELGAPRGATEWTVSGYLVGLSLGLLFWGPIGDRHGRRRPILLGLVLFAIGSAGCALAGSIWSLIGWRLVQALGASAGVGLSRAMVRDLYKGHRAAEVMSALITVLSIAPLIGPIIGGQILAAIGWRAIFWALVGIGFVTFAAFRTLPETLLPSERVAAGIGKAIYGYCTLLRNWRLLAYLGATGFFYVGIFAYIAGGPFALITYHHLPPTLFGFVFGIGMVGVMTFSTINMRLVGRRSSKQLLKIGATMALLSGLGAIAAAITGFGGLVGLAVPLTFYIAANGFVVANALTGAMKLAPSSSGSVSALAGAVQYGSGMFGSTLVGALADGTPRPMAAVMAVAAALSFLCVFLIKD